MFTGIIQNQGMVAEKKNAGKQVRFLFRFQKPEKNIRPGESIAVNGVCLTVAAKRPGAFQADVIQQTLQATNLGKLRAGGRVNLERSLKWGEPIGGHFVTGHVDATGVLRKILRYGKNVTFEISFPTLLKPNIIKKGSLALDGISLTVQSVRGNLFSVGLVPHTLRETNLGQKNVGDRLNLEIDLLSRYLQNRKGDRGIFWKGLFKESGCVQNRLISVKRLKALGF